MHMICDSDRASQFCVSYVMKTETWNEDGHPETVRYSDLNDPFFSVKIRQIDGEWITTTVVKAN